jgi:serine/threonine-protein kinase
MINAHEFETSVEYDLFTCDFGCEFLKNYQIIDCLNISGNSTVFKIRRFSDGSPFTLKAIRLDDNIKFNLDKLTELDHPGLASIVAHGTSSNYQYVVKTYIEGETLRQYITRNGPMKDSMVKRVADQLIEVFEYLHSRPEPFIFRDLKPANIVVTPEFKIVLIDLETIRQTRSEQTSDTFYVGTHGYASPEQYGYKQSDERSDIYTIGATLYYLYTAEEPPILPQKQMKVMQRNLRNSFQLAHVINICMAFNPEDRFKNVGSIKKAIRKRYHISPKSFKRVKWGSVLVLITLILFSFRHMAIEAIVDIIEDNGYIEQDVETKVETKIETKINVVMRDPSVGNLQSINLPTTDEIYCIEGKSIELFPPEAEIMIEIVDVPIVEQAPMPIAEPQPDIEPLPELVPVIEEIVASETLPDPEPTPTIEPKPIKNTSYISQVDQEEYLNVPRKFIYVENRNGSVGYRLDSQNIIFKFILDHPPDQERNTLFLMGDTPGLYHDFSLPEGTLVFLVTIDIEEYKLFKEGVIVGFGGSFLGVNDEFCEYLEL